MKSYLYSDIELLRQDLLQNIESYANEHKINVYLMQYPQSESVEKEKYECFVLMAPGHKLVMMNVSEDREQFENFCYDVEATISYLYIKYEYQQELGRFQPLWRDLKASYNVDALADVDKFFHDTEILDVRLKRYSSIFVSLCTGSINDIMRVKGNVPTTLLDKVKQKIQLFDADQTRFIYQRIDQKRIKIQGLSGTGKTELLLHKLKELYVREPQSKLFITCHNRILADALHKKIPQFFNFMKVSQQIEWNERLWCTNAWGRYGDSNTGFYRYLCGFYDIAFQAYTPYTTFDVVCQRAIEEITKSKKNGKEFAFDYVLVDECQDFPDSFFDLCELVTKKQVFLSGDIFQSIFEEHSINDYSVDFFLTKCYRTDPKTLMFAHALGLGLFEKNPLRWLKEEDWKACGYSYEEKDGNIKLSREPVRRFSDLEEEIRSVEIEMFSENSIAEKVVEIINKIKKENEDVSVNDICIILLDENDHTYKWANLIESRVNIAFGWSSNKAYESKQTVKDSLFISNRNNVKGLEYSFVICITKRLVFSVPYRNSIYTMLTRSFLKSYLLISSDEAGNSKVLAKRYALIEKDHCLTLKKPTPEELKKIETSFKRLKTRRPMADEINDYLTEKNIPKEKIVRYTDIAIRLGWQDYSTNELRAKLDNLILLSNF